MIPGKTDHANYPSKQVSRKGAKDAENCNDSLAQRRQGRQEQQRQGFSKRSQSPATCCFG
jgi:hypothetical protein